MDPIVTGSLIKAGSSLISSIFGTNSAKRQQKREQEFNAEQAQLNRDFQREERLATQDFNVNMWNMENEYNSPANQLKRAQEAGINPNAIIGGIDNTSAGAVTSSPMSGSQASYSGSIAESLLTLNPELAQMAAMTEKLISETKGQDIQNSFAPTVNETSINKAQAETDKIKKEAGFTDEQTRQIKELFPLLKGKNETELSKMQEEINNLIEQRKQIIAQTGNVEQDTKLKESQTGNVQQDTKLKEAQTGNVQQDTKLKEAQTGGSEQDLKLKKWENDFIATFGVSPNAKTLQSIIQLIASGEKGANIAQAMVNTMFNMLKGFISGRFNVYQEILPTAKAKEFGNRIGQRIRNTFDRMSSIWR